VVVPRGNTSCMVEAASDGGPLCCNRSVALYAQGGCGVPGCEACDVLHRLELTDQIALADLSQIKTPCPNHDYYMPVVLLWFHCDDMLVATDRMDPVDFHLIQLRYTGEDVDWFACCASATPCHFDAPLLSCTSRPSWLPWCQSARALRTWSTSWWRQVHWWDSTQHQKQGPR